MGRARTSLFQVKRALMHGVNNPIAARLTLQTLDLLSKTTLSDADRNTIGGTYMESLVQKLLRCWKIEQRLRKEWESSISKFKAPERGLRRVTQVLV